MIRHFLPLLLLSAIGFNAAAERPPAEALPLEPLQVLQELQANGSGNAEQLFASHRQAVFRIDVIHPATGRKSSLGTGFTVGQPNLLASNFHVIAAHVHRPEQTRLEWQSEDGRRGPLQLIAVDVVHDLALLRAEQDLAPPLATAALPAKGAALFAMGHPLGLELAIVSGTANGLLEKSLFDKIHFSGNLNPGMSGGPALDTLGRVVGINVATAGEAVSFLVPAVYLEQLLASARSRQFAADSDFHLTIRDQLVAHNDSLLAEIRQHQADQQALGKAKVPGELSPRIDCWGEVAPADSRKPMRTLASLCQGDDQIHISDELGAGQISYEFFWFDSEKLRDRDFARLYQRHFSSRFPGDAGREQVGNFSCDVRFVAIAGKAFKANVCARPYRRYPGLIDFMAVLALVGERHEGMIITLDLGGVTLPQGMSLLANLLERITWQS